MSDIYPVYVVDDQPEMRDFLCELCRDRGLDCREFDDGESFLADLEGLDPGCVLLDIRMPRRNGLQVQAEMARRGRTLPVIAMSGRIDVETVVDSMKLGALDFLEKPFANDTLFEALDRGFERLRSGKGTITETA